MAYNKAVDSAVLDSTLTAIANAIREKGGTSDPIAFDAMAAAVEAIEAGGDIGGRDYIYTTYTPSEDISNTIYIPIEKDFGEKSYHNRIVYWTTPINRDSSATPSKINFGMSGVSYYDNPRNNAMHCVVNKYGSVGSDLSTELYVGVGDGYITFGLNSSLVVKAGTTIYFLVMDATLDYI